MVAVLFWQCTNIYCVRNLRLKIEKTPVLALSGVTFATNGVSVSAAGLSDCLLRRRVSHHLNRYYIHAKP